MKGSSGKITLAHGNGGRLMHDLIERVRLPLANPVLDQMSDAAELSVSHGRWAFTTDSFVVRPLFFPGGDIGRLAVFGTVNDLAMKGAVPLFLSLAFIIEEGLDLSILDRIVRSIRAAARETGVRVVTGDTKVVEKGAADQIFINTAGLGAIRHRGRPIGPRARAQDVILINGPIAEHGMAVLEARERFGFVSGIKSDCAPVDKDVQRCLKASKRISVMRDPTRGGVATALSEIARGSGLGIEIDEEAIPVKRGVRKMCDVLGFDPLYVANEGKFLCFVPARDAARMRRAMGKDARVIGRVVPAHPGEVYLKTTVGKRILPVLEADQLPRIC